MITTTDLLGMRPGESFVIGGSKVERTGDQVKSWMVSLDGVKREYFNVAAAANAMNTTYHTTT